MVKLCTEAVVVIRIFNVRKRQGIDGKTLYCSCGGNEDCILRIKTEPVTKCEEKDIDGKTL